MHDMAACSHARFHVGMLRPSQNGGWSCRDGGAMSHMGRHVDIAPHVRHGTTIRLTLRIGSDSVHGRFGHRPRRQARKEPKLIPWKGQPSNRPPAQQPRRTQPISFGIKELEEIARASTEKNKGNDWGHSRGAACTKQKGKPRSKSLSRQTTTIQKSPSRQRHPSNPTQQHRNQRSSERRS